MQVLSTIIPIFAVVILGWFARRRGFMPPEFLGPANQLVYYLAIPALIFRSILRASFHTQFNMMVLIITLSSAVLAYFSAWLIGHATRWPKGRIGTFIQCSAHGNHGFRSCSAQRADEHSAPNRVFVKHVILSSLCWAFFNSWVDF